jgi:hypothetical protein
MTVATLVHWSLHIGVVYTLQWHKHDCHLAAEYWSDPTGHGTIALTLPLPQMWINEMYITLPRGRNQCRVESIQWSAGWSSKQTKLFHIENHWIMFKLQWTVASVVSVTCKRCARKQVPVNVSTLHSLCIIMQLGRLVPAPPPPNSKCFGGVSHTKCVIPYDLLVDGLKKFLCFHVLISLPI